MYCNNPNCAWRGELTSQRIAMVGTATHCGLCMQEASAAPSNVAEIRRDEDMAEQPKQAEEAEKMFHEKKPEKPKPKRRSILRRREASDDE